MIEIVPYRNEWRAEFADIGQRLRAALGDHALRIDHIGSTSVPGLAAKDIVDVQVTIADFTKLEEIQEAMAQAGYDLKFFGVYDDMRPLWSEQEQDWEKAYFREQEGAKRTHIHMRAEGRANQRYALLFRDYLRAHPQVALHYAEMKQKMAEYFGHLEDHTPYIEGKDPMVNLIASLAKEWGDKTGWQPGAADA